MVADQLGLDVLVGAAVLLDRVDVHAALVRERALADVRLRVQGVRLLISSTVRASVAQLLELLGAHAGAGRA